MSANEREWSLNCLFNNLSGSCIVNYYSFMFVIELCEQCAGIVPNGRLAGADEIIGGPNAVGEEYMHSIFLSHPGKRPA